MKTSPSALLLPHSFHHPHRHHHHNHHHHHQGAIPKLHHGQEHSRLGDSTALGDLTPRQSSHHQLECTHSGLNYNDRHRRHHHHHQHQQLQESQHHGFCRSVRHLLMPSRAHLSNAVMMMMMILTLMTFNFPIANSLEDLNQFQVLNRPGGSGPVKNLSNNSVRTSVNVTNQKRKYVDDDANKADSLKWQPPQQQQLQGNVERQGLVSPTKSYKNVMKQEEMPDLPPVKVPGGQEDFVLSSSTLPPTSDQNLQDWKGERQDFKANLREDAGGDARHFHWPSPVATPGPRVQPGVRSDVEWNYAANYYSLKASSDSRFLIRYAPPPSPGTPWPHPQTYSSTPNVMKVDPTKLDFSFTLGSSKKSNRRRSAETENDDDDEEYIETDGHCSVLDFTIARIRKITFGGRWDKSAQNVVAEPPYEERAGRGDDADDDSAALSQLKQVVVKVDGPCERNPHLNMNESYTLKISKNTLTINSAEVWGALRGLETFGQLVYQTEADPFLYYINKTYIKDFPRFKHRGIHLDTARHYLEMSTLLENLESMAQNKFNVFHWHIVDDQSFPFKSQSYPNLTRFGAYDPETHVYTQEDVALVIEQARLRGIRVIPEFDTPGHTFSWGFGQNHLLTPCYSYDGKFNGLYGPINPILRKNYNFLQNFFKEVMSVFKDKYLHLGGDEVPFECWMSNPQIKKFMKKNSIVDIKQILSFYARQLITLIGNNAKNLNRKTGSIVWQEMFDNDVDLPLDTIIQVWSGDSYDLERIIRAGYGVLFSTCWYLDYIQYGQDWDKYYICEHISNLHLRNESFFYGGEVCLWAEYTDDSDILTRLWPRASAAGERLWSNRNVNNLYRAAPRLEMQRCRMMERGLQVGVLSGPSHCPKYRKKRQRASGGPSNGSRSSVDDFWQEGNPDKRKLSKYGEDDEEGMHLRRHKESNFGRPVQLGKAMGSGSLSSISNSWSGSFVVYSLVSFFFFFSVCFLLKRKWVKLPIPTYFLVRNYRAFVLCLIFVTASLIWLQNMNFSSPKPSP